MDDEPRDDPLHQAFEILRRHAVEISDEFSDLVRAQLDSWSAAEERRPPTLLTVLGAVVVDTTNLLTGLGHRALGPEEPDDE